MAQLWMYAAASFAYPLLISHAAVDGLKPMCSKNSPDSFEIRAAPSGSAAIASRKDSIGKPGDSEANRFRRESSHAASRSYRPILLSTSRRLTGGLR